MRALIVERLEASAASGNTLLPRDSIIDQIRALKIEPSCEVTDDTIVVAEKMFGDEVAITEMANRDTAYQLCRLTKAGELIRDTITKRIGAARHSIDADWRALLDAKLQAEMVSDPEEEAARKEKAAALVQLAESRVSVLIGSAGTGKTLLLSVLCSHPDIANGAVGFESFIVHSFLSVSDKKRDGRRHPLFLIC